MASNFCQAAVSAGIILVRSRISGNRHVCRVGRAPVRCSSKGGEGHLFFEPFGVRIIGKPQAPPSKNKDHWNILGPEVLGYFKGLAEETELPCQKLTSLYLLNCAKKRKKTLRKVRASRELSLRRRRSAYSHRKPVYLVKPSVLLRSRCSRVFQAHVQRNVDVGTSEKQDVKKRLLAAGHRGSTKRNADSGGDSVLRIERRVASGIAGGKWV